MKKITSTLLCLIMTAAIVLLPETSSAADSTENYHEIHDSQGLLAMAEDPDGSYILMNDIDMAGVEWKPVDFSGTLDGNGYAVINLTVSDINDTSSLSYDGNMKSYDTYYSGLFGIMTDAQIINLTLINERISIDTDEPCFVGGIAGSSVNSKVDNCQIYATLSLTTGSKMFGVGGVIGFGYGNVDNSVVDVTLVCTDTNTDERNEQFMGGVLADGYVDISGCDVTIAGFDSDHGYVHNGGMIGMYMFYPAGTEHYGYLLNNRIEGKITFFEDNTDRRAYCKEYIGEVMNWEFNKDGNTDNFIRDERMDYSVNLYPEMCSSPEYIETVTSPSCDSFGFTTYECRDCGYTYTDNYTLKQHHIDKWEVTVNPSYTASGVETGECTVCGETQTREVEMLLIPSQLTLNTDSLTMKKTATKQLEASVIPDNAAVYMPKWTSSDTSVATVDDTGLVTAVSNGQAVITYSLGNNEISTSCEITVKSPITWWWLVVAAVLLVLVILIICNAILHRRGRRR